MRTVSVSNLKAHLSEYLREVQRGGEVQVVDRGVPIARLMPLERARGLDEDHWHRLIRAGVLRAGTGDAAFVLDTPPASIPGLSLSAALDDERGDRG